MNKTLLLAAAAGLSFSLLAGVPSDARAQGANAFPVVCKQLQEDSPEQFEEVFGNLGGCVSSPATLFCRDPELREDIEEQFDTEFRNQGQCVSFLRHLSEEEVGG